MADCHDRDAQCVVTIVTILTSLGEVAATTMPEDDMVTVAEIAVVVLNSADSLR